MGMQQYCYLRVLVLLSICCVPIVYSASNITTKGTELVDDVGRVVVLRGLNLPINAKMAPFEPLKDKKALSRLQTLPLYGASIARVLFTWEAFEPERGQYNLDYLNYYLTLVETLYSQGILTIVDMHQDFYSRWLNLGCGEGFPRWAILVDPILQKNPWNGPTCVAWILQGPFDVASKLNWKLFYAGENGVRDRFLDMWEYLAKTFAKNPAVIGYDILNEPYGDEVNEIGPLYEDAAKRIRKYDQNAILFIEPQIYKGAGSKTNLPQPTFSNYVMAFHYYGQTRDPHKVIVSSFEEALTVWTNQTEAWDVPMFFGEFGANTDKNLDNADFQAPNYISMFYDELDARLLGGTQWGWTDDYNDKTKDGWNSENFSIVDQRRNLRSNFAVRPYPKAIAGIPGQFKVDSIDKVMQLSWEVTDATLAAGAASGGRGATTVLFAPIQGFFAVPHAEQLDIQVTPNAGLTCSYSTDWLTFNCLASQAGSYTLIIQPQQLA
nr:putative extracellular protein CSOL_010 [Pseudococcomyxa simplex]